MEELFQKVIIALLSAEGGSVPLEHGPTIGGTFRSPAILTFRPSVLQTAVGLTKVMNVRGNTRSPASGRFLYGEPAGSKPITPNSSPS